MIALALPFPLMALLALLAGITLFQSLRSNPVVQLLRVVDFVAARIAAGVEVPDPLEMVADIPDDVAVHDLGMVDVEQDLHARRAHARHHVHACGWRIPNCAAANTLTNARSFDLARTWARFTQA
jgi:hypothetical protein